MRLSLLPSERHLTVNGYSILEQEEIYDYQLEEVLTRTRWYLDNLTTMNVYYVSWKDYRRTSPVTPYKFVRKE